MNEMNGLTVDFGCKVRSFIKLRLLPAPIEVEGFLCQILHVGKVWSAIILPGDHCRPNRFLDALVQVVELGLRDTDFIWFDFGRHCFLSSYRLRINPQA